MPFQQRLLAAAIPLASVSTALAGAITGSEYLAAGSVLLLLANYLGDWWERN